LQGEQNRRPKIRIAAPDEIEREREGVSEILHSAARRVARREEQLLALHPV
jgi:hypothetical protein